MNEDVKVQLKEVLIDAMSSFKKEHSNLMYEVLKEIRDSREESREVMAVHKLEDQKGFSDINLKLNTLEQQTAPIRRAWAQAIRYGVAITLGAVGIKFLK